MKKAIQPGTLMWDVEVSPIIAAVYDMYDARVQWVLKDPFILSIAYKYYGEKKAYVLALPDFPRYKRDKTDDRPLLEAFQKIFNKADITMGHNSDKFDNKVLNARYIVNGLPPPKPTVKVDTLKIARRNFGFKANSLAELGRILGVEQKMHIDMRSVSKGCMEGNLKDWDILKKYNKQDVIVTEAIYRKMSPFDERGFNANVITRDTACPNVGCGSYDRIHRGHRRGLNWEAASYTCGSCGKCYQGPKERLTPVHIR